MLARLVVLVILAVTVCVVSTSLQYADIPSVEVAEIDTVSEEIEEVALPGHVPCSAPVPDAVLDLPRTETALSSYDGARVFRPPRVFGS